MVDDPNFVEDGFLFKAIREDNQELKVILALPKETSVSKFCAFGANMFAPDIYLRVNYAKQIKELEEKLILIKHEATALPSMPVENETTKIRENVVFFVQIYEGFDSFFEIPTTDKTLKFAFDLLQARAEARGYHLNEDFPFATQMIGDTLVARVWNLHSINEFRPIN
jgi:hypothetical protein